MVMKTDIKKDSHCAVISLGSNYLNRIQNIELCLEWLSNHKDVKLLSHSSIYETSAINGSGVLYMNAVAVVTTTLPSASLDALFKEYEYKMGRDDNCRIRGCVPIDIDIVIWDGTVLRIKDRNCAFFIKGYNELVSFLNL